MSANGGPAFPVYPRVEGYKTSEIKDALGMSLRDWFAGQALAGFATGVSTGAIDPTECAKDCYVMANALLAEREKK